MSEEAARDASRAELSRRGLLVAGLSGVSLAACAPEGSTSSQRSSAASTHGPTGTATPAPQGSGAQTSAPQTSAGQTAEPPTPSPVPSIATTPGPDITHGPRDQPRIALTFHGQGALAIAHSILATCADVNAGITVFAVGTWVHANPRIGHEILRAGHELGNHTWSHQQMKQLSSSAATREAVKGSEALIAAVGSRGIWFRPSGTRNSTPTIRAAARTAGYQRCVSYDVDPEDFLDPGAAAVRDRTLAAARPGSIVSLHFGHAGTAEALPGILRGLGRAGLQPVTLSTLLADA
jgi:peptidoglycan/xylan/chitin deacetylase (PgdA/CDA1 family)